MARPHARGARWISRILSTALVALLFACGEDGTSPEVIDSLFLPPDAPTTPGNDGNASPFSGAARRFQAVYGAPLLSGLPVGSRITGMRFRLGAGGMQVISGTVTNFEVRLSTSARQLGNLSATFSENRGGNEVVVRSGEMVIAPGDYPTGNSPNAWGPLIEFQQPFVYPGGPLLLEIGMTGIANGGAMDNHYPVTGSETAYGSADGFDTATADLGIYEDLIVVEYRFIRP